MNDRIAKRRPRLKKLEPKVVNVTPSAEALTEGAKIPAPVMGRAADFRDSPSEVKQPSRYVPAQVRRRVWRRDHGRCTYVDPATRRKCSSQRYLQYDHIQPFSVGGVNTEANLRLRCSTHNRLAAIEFFGRGKMAKSIREQEPV